MLTGHSISDKRTERERERERHTHTHTLHTLTLSLSHTHAYVETSDRLSPHADKINNDSNNQHWPQVLTTHVLFRLGMHHSSDNQCEARIVVLVNVHTDSLCAQFHCALPPTHLCNAERALENEY